MIKSIKKNHIEYYKGNAPLILSAPHGGDEMPDNINTRTKGVFDKDDHTLELTQLIIKEFYEQTTRSNANNFTFNSRR